MNWASFFETLMIVCFGLSWPLAIVRSLRTKSTKGKSPFFMCFIAFGYICGIIAKQNKSTPGRWNSSDRGCFCYDM